MADDYESWTPYIFSFNNPILFNDPTGLEPETGLTPETAKELETVYLISNPKNSWNYPRWRRFADANKHLDVVDVTKYLKNQGVDDRGLTLFNKAWNGIGYRERKEEIDRKAWEFEGMIAKEIAIWLAGDGLFYYGGKVVNWGHRGYKVWRRAKTAKAAKTGTQLLNAAPAKLTQQGLEHIVARHWFTSGAKGAGKFIEGTTARGLKGMIETATTKGVFRANTYGRAGTIAEYNFGRVIGTTSGGAPASSLRVVIGPNGNVITAFPY